MSKRNQKILLKIINDFLHHQPYNLTFAPISSLTSEEKANLQQYLKESFESWFKSWVKDPIEKALDII